MANQSHFNSGVRRDIYEVLCPEVETSLLYQVKKGYLTQRNLVWKTWFTLLGENETTYPLSSDVNQWKTILIK